MFPSFAGLSDSVSQLGCLPFIPGFAFGSSVHIFTDYALSVSYALPPPYGVLETSTH
ncbi:hypothetical protein [Paenibacillus crassostreae]|uniref:hypothetical protein n=1 Tax=Paenibacillus crassostreae TaxID=1763538 RepID=UPI000ADEF480|nr:hypothetical protein [Paenibacillus crassostreae]